VTVGFTLAHVVLPRSLSSRLPRHGWVSGRPSWLNLLSLPLLAGGFAGVFWAMALHYFRAPEGWELETTPNYLLLRGPYRFTRNPMYLAELALWLGWALYYGSTAILTGFLLLLALFEFFVVPREERGLEARFGEAYRQYREKVPRWVGRPHR
jgi:protein-S-isoprenylcysteine O-methyltransferase Ste14